MWDGPNFGGGGMGPHRGMPERSIRDWRREVLPPREFQMLDRLPADFPGRQPPSSFQGRGDSFGMQLEHDRKRVPPFEMGTQRGPPFGPRHLRGIEDALLDFMGGDVAHVNIVRGRSGMDLRGRDLPSREFGMQNQAFVDQRGWDGPAGEYRGRDAPPHSFRDFGPPSPEFRGQDMPSLDFRVRDVAPGGYRGRDISPGSYRGRDIPSDFRGRPSFPSGEFRGRDATSQEFRRWEGTRTEFSGHDTPSSEYRGRDDDSRDFRDVSCEDRRSTPPLDFSEHDASHSSRPVDELVSEEDKDLNKTQTVDSADSERSLSDYRVSGGPAADLPERERSPINASGRDTTDSDFRNHERLSSDFSADDLHSDAMVSADTSISTESREQPSSLDSRNRGAASSSDSKLEEQTSGLSECSGKREESLEFLGGEDADYRGRNYQDVDLRVPGMFDYRHGKSDDPSKSDPDLKDQDYRTASRDEKKSTCIMIDGLPRKATSNDVLSAFKNPDGSTMSGFRLANLTTGYSHGFAFVEFSHLEEAVRCMEANQKNLTICGKRVSIRYSDPPVEWTCKYCEKVNGPNRERCTNCDTKKSEALAGHSSSESSRHSKGQDRRQESERETTKRQSRQSESQQESKSSSKSEKESWHRTSTPPRHSPLRETQSPTSSTTSSQHTSEAAEEASKSIIIKNISQSTTVNTILKALDPYAYLVKENVRIITSKRSGGNRGYAFVEMDSSKEAEHLVSILQKLNSAFTIGGRVVSVEVAKSTRRSPSHSAPEEVHTDDSSANQARKDKKGSPQHTSSKAATRRSSPEVNRSSSPISPDDATYLYDATSGFYYDPRTGLYFDPKSEYHYDAETKQYLTWDPEEKKYIPVPNQSDEEVETKKSSPPRTRRRSSSPRSRKRSSSPRGRRRSASPRGRRRSTSPRARGSSSPRTRDTTSPRNRREKRNSQDKRASARPEHTRSAERERRESRERKDARTLQEQQVARDLERWASALEKQMPPPRTSPRTSRLEADDTKELKGFDDVFVKPERPVSVPSPANKPDDPFKKPPTPPPPAPATPPAPVVVKKKKKKNQAELKQKTSSFINLLAEYGSGSEEEEEEEEEEEVEVVVEEKMTPPAVPQQKQQSSAEQQTVPKQQPQQPKLGDDEKLTDWEKLACLLCRRQFPTKEGLIRHQQLSDLHKQNLAIHCQIKMSQQELEYLEQKEREVKGKKRPALKKERALEGATTAPREKKRVKYSSDFEDDIWPSDQGRSGEGKQLGTGSSSSSSEGVGKAGAAKGRSGTASSYRDAVRKAMFARFKELD